MEPKITIVVPVYNVEPYLNKCICSLLVQTFTDYELILVDDGSSDRCGEICDAFAQSDQRVTVIHQEHRGTSAARNAGIKAARGKYIGFVDSDDYIHHRMYETLYDAVERYSSDIAVCGFVKVSEQDEAGSVDTQLPSDVRHFTNIEALHELYRNRQGTLITNSAANITWVVVWNKLYNRSLFDHLQFEEGRIFEDEWMMHHLLYASRKITYIPSILYFYVQRSGSILHSPFSIKKFDRVYALKERAVFFKKINQRYLHQLALVGFLDAFFWNYNRAKGFIETKNETEQLKKTVRKYLFPLMTNRLLSWRVKVMLLLFFYCPLLYKTYGERKMPQ